MAFDEREIAAINELFLVGENEAGVRRVAKILDDRRSDYGTAISALALLRNHGMERDWAEWAAALKKRDFGVPSELVPRPFPHRESFSESPWKFERLGGLVRFGQSGSSLALNPVTSVTLDDEGIELKRRFGSEAAKWSELSGGRVQVEQTKKMADLVRLPGIRRTLILDRTAGPPLELDVSTCVREFEFPLHLLAAIRTRVVMAD